MGKATAAKELKPLLTEHDPAYPPRFFNDSATMWDGWDKLDISVRREIVRSAHEQMRGIAIQKDRRCGRAKHDLQGFFGLELAWDRLHDLVCRGVPEDDPQRVEAHNDVVRLTRKLTADTEELKSKDQNIEAADEAEPIAKSHGMTVPEWLRACVGIEQQFRADPLGGIFATCEHIDVDPLHVLAQALQSPPSALSSEQVHRW